jgi:lipopolysaccharide biosynthesis glycosyltransferase
MINAFIGYDKREAIAFNVLSYSIYQRSSKPVSITPIMLTQLQDVFNRERHPLQSTEFSFSRFLTPWLCNYEGWAIFMDCDMLALDDIARLWDLREEQYSVMVVKHEHIPKQDKKFLNEPQSKYEKKNWSSVILFNNHRCKALTPEYVNTASGLDLHQFKWLEHDQLIGTLPCNWNHLVDYSPPTSNISLLHYTSGGPYFSDHKNSGYSKEWHEEYYAMSRL